MNRLQESEIEWVGRYYGQLVGHRIVEVIAEIDEFDGSVWPVLRTVDEVGNSHELSVSRDPEGNGPGFLHGLPHPTRSSA